MYIIPNTAQYNNKVVKSNTVTILTPVKDKSNSININQIQQSIKDNHRLKNSNNKILNFLMILQLISNLLIIL